MQERPETQAHVVDAPVHLDLDLHEPLARGHIMPKMEDVTHDGKGSQIDLEGYRSCRNEWCGRLVLKEVAERTQGLCTDCFRTHLGDQMAEVEVVARGGRLSVKSTGQRRNQSSKGDRATKKRVEQAKRRALRRLRAVFPELFDVFYAEERARVGLEPWPIETVVQKRAPIDAQQTMDFARVYHALTEHGVDVDGLEDEHAHQDPLLDDG